MSKLTKKIIVILILIIVNINFIFPNVVLATESASANNSNEYYEVSGVSRYFRYSTRFFNICF